MEPEFNGDFVYRFVKNVNRADFLIRSERLSYVTNVFDII